MPPVFVKVYLDATQLEREVMVLRRADAGGIPVAPVITFESGPPAIVITEQVSGIPLSAEYPRAAEATGRLLRQFHALGASPPFVDGQQHWSNFVRDWLERELVVTMDRGAVTCAEAGRLRQHFASRASILDERPVALIHGDFQTDHVLIDPATQRVTALLDFVDTQPGDPLVDIAVLTLFDRQLESLVLRGYGMDLGEAEGLISSYRLLRHLVAANWLVENGVPHLAPPHEQAVHQLISGLTGSCEAGDRVRYD